MKPTIYLDYAAATPVDAEAKASLETYLSDRFYNPSAAYQAARDVRRDLEAARADVANVLGCRDQEIFFTAGGTEANNLAIRSIMAKYPDGHIVVSSIEHESVLETAEQFNYTKVEVDNKGLVDVASLRSAITDQTVLVSVMYANNEIGTIQPIREIADMIKQQQIRRAAEDAGSESPKYPIYLHTDACQAANYLDLQVSRLEVDLMTLNGGKIYAPKQSGALYIRRGTEFDSQMTGGGQESGFRSGTENVASSIAFATMLQSVQRQRKTESDRLRQMRDGFFATLSQKIPDLSVNGHLKKRLPNNLNITFPGLDGERLLMELDESGLMVATGSACTASSDEPSYVLQAIGLSKEEASSSLRITLGRPTTEEEMKKAAEIITTVVGR